MNKARAGAKAGAHVRGGAKTVWVVRVQKGLGGERFGVTYRGECTSTSFEFKIASVACQALAVTNSGERAHACSGGEGRHEWGKGL